MKFSYNNFQFLHYFVQDSQIFISLPCNLVTQRIIDLEIYSFFLINKADDIKNSNKYLKTLNTKTFQVVQV